jgi:DNA modification methylase
MGIVKEERIGPHRLILGDCLSIMPLLGKVDAVVTDPPYGVRDVLRSDASKRSRWFTRKAGDVEWDVVNPEAIRFAIECSGAAIVWGGNFYELPPSRGWLVWNKVIRNFSTSVCELAWTTLEMPIDAFDYSHGQLAHEGKKHPTQKPLPLMEWCLGFLPDARTILDPFMGSGTTLVACQRLGRHGIGIEIDPGYFDIACKRVDEASRQPDLFIAPQPQPVQEGMDL